MALKITDDCINCNACESECPNTAIYEGGISWALADGTQALGSYSLISGDSIDATEKRPALVVDHYYIVPDKCTECQGFHEEPQCASVCPVDCCVPDEQYAETVATLLEKKERLHKED